MKTKIQNIILGLVLVSCALLQGCFQDYTVQERVAVSGKLSSATERQDVAFQFDNVSSFPVFQVRLRDWGSPTARIEVTDYQRLPDLRVPGTHFEMWASSDVRQVSFGKFKLAGGELVSFLNGQTGATKCASVGATKLCTFTPAAGTPVFTDLDRIQVSIESSGDADTVQQGSVMLAGFQINQFEVEPLTFPVSFSQNAITATASITLFADEAKDGLVRLNLTAFPVLDNRFAYQLWSADNIGGFVACGNAFNVNAAGQIVDAVSNQPAASNVFSCANTDLAARSAMVISLEPTYEGNSSDIFAYRPYSLSYAPFTNTSFIKLPINNVRASIAGAPRDRTLSDVEGNFGLATVAQGRTFVVLRSPDFEPSFIDITVTRPSAIGGLSKDMIPKRSGEALFHFFQQDYGKPVQTVVVPELFDDFFQPLALNDEGVNGDLIKGDGVWTVRKTGLSAGKLVYSFTVNSADKVEDPHAENLDVSGIQKEILVK